MTGTNGKAIDAAQRVVAVCDVLAAIVESGFGEYAQDTRTQWAVEMGLIRVGEGINRVPEEILERFRGQPWRQIVGMGNFAAHQYDDLDPARVWRTLTRDIPALRHYLVEVLIPGLAR